MSLCRDIGSHRHAHHRHALVEIMGWETVSVKRPSPRRTSTDRQGCRPALLPARQDRWMVRHGTAMRSYTSSASSANYSVRQGCPDLWSCHRLQISSLLSASIAGPCAHGPSFLRLRTCRGSLSFVRNAWGFSVKLHAGPAHGLPALRRMPSRSSVDLQKGRQLSFLAS